MQFSQRQETIYRACTIKGNGMSMDVFGYLYLISIEGNNNVVNVSGRVNNINISGNDNQVKGQHNDPSVNKININGKKNKVADISCKGVIIMGNNNEVSVTNMNWTRVTGIMNRLYNNGIQQTIAGNSTFKSDQTQRNPLPTPFRRSDFAVGGHPILPANESGPRRMLPANMFRHDQVMELPQPHIQQHTLPSSPFQNRHNFASNEEEALEGYNYPNQGYYSGENDYDQAESDEFDREEDKEMHVVYSLGTDAEIEESEEVEEEEVKQRREAVANLFPEYLYQIGNENCSICLEHLKMRDVVKRLGCLHIFHKSCVDTWLRSKPICPLCRIPLIPGLD